MEIKAKKDKTIRQRYIIQSKLFSDLFYSLFDGYDLQEKTPVYVLKFHEELVSPQFVDFCIQSLQDYLYQPIKGLFELVDFEYDGEEFYIFYKFQESSLVSLELFLKKTQSLPDSSKKRYKLLLKISRILFDIEQKNLVFGNFSLNNVFISENQEVVLGPAKVNLVCLEFFISNVDVFEGSIFITPEFLKDFNISVKTDIYGFGVLAYYLVTLHWPYDNKQSLVRLKNCFKKGPKRCSSYNSKISDKLNFFIMKSIQLDAKERWHTFRTIIDVLEGKETIKTETIANQSRLSDAFFSDLKIQRQFKFGGIVSMFTNLILIFIFILVFYFAYLSYFKTYEVVEIPNLNEQSLAEAKVSLELLKLKPRIIKYNFHPTVPEGQVIRIDPPVGRSIKQGRSVKLFISKGRQEVVVPDFLSKSKEEIYFILQGSNMEIEEMPPVFSVEVESGKVVSQVPLPNQYMFDNGKIQLVYSKGSPVEINVLSELDDDYKKISVKFMFSDDYDVVDFEVIEKINDDQFQELYSGINYGGDLFFEEYVVNVSSSIVIKLNGDEIYSNETTEED